MGYSNYYRTFLLLSLVTCIACNTDNSIIYQLLKKYGLHRRYVICDSTLFEFFLGAVCKHHTNAYQKRSIADEAESMFMEENQARSFLKTRKSIDNQDNHLSFKDECCNTSDGCDVNEIYGYCNYYLPSVHLIGKKKK